MIRIFIADDHPLVRQGVKRILEETPGFRLVGEASTAQETLAEITSHKCDVLLLDIAMPGRDGLEVLRHLKQTQAHLAVLVLSMYPAHQYAVRALKAGAAGYLSKDVLPGELVTAIRKVARDGWYISPTVADHLAFAVTQEGDKPLYQSLSDREYQVLCFFGAGKTATEIAEELCLSVKTISTYRARILEKMHLKTTAELIRYALEQQLVD